jgi:hypothetical protein
MRWILPLSLLAALPTAMPAIGHAESWCIRDSAGITSEICAFSSVDDCVRAALVGPSGGIVCVRERNHGAKAGGHFNNAALQGSPHERRNRPTVF